MGYCYQGRKLCCDHCGFAGARKMRCPYGHCIPNALCATCRKGEPGKATKAYHVENRCEEKHAAYAAEQAAKEAAKAEGELLFCAALGQRDEQGNETGIKVWFKGATLERCYVTDRAGYEAVCGKRPYATEQDLTGHPAMPVEA